MCIALCVIDFDEPAGSVEGIDPLRFRITQQVIGAVVNELVRHIQPISERPGPAAVTTAKPIRQRGRAILQCWAFSMSTRRMYASP